jgi:mycothiol synthase
VIEVRRTVTEHVADLENLQHSRQRMSAAYLLARLDGTPAGCGMSAIFPGTEEQAVLFADASVAPSYRRRGIGEALLREISVRARELGKETLQLEVREDDEASVHFVEKRGFEEIERQKEVTLDLTKLGTPPPVEPPDGVRIVSRAEEPGFEREHYELELAAGRDIPGLDSAVSWTFEEWRSFAVDRPGIDPGLCFYALAGEELVGCASIVVIGGTAYHGLTAVARDWRGRGIAQALKRAQIAAALERGHTKLVTESQHENVAMRTLNEKLGYEPSPGQIVYRGPLLAGSV